jgi:hypothetical protein
MENRGQYQKNPPLNIEQLERLVVELKGWGEDNGDRNDCKDRTSQRFRYAELCLQEDPEIVNNNGLR